MEDFKKLAEQYKSELLDSVLPFWLEKSQDKEFGGYFTCLDRKGEVFDTDKFWFIDHVFTVYDKNTIKENNIDINCGGKDCLGCQQCYHKGTEFYIREKLK